ncbi:4-alpha-glucanotransferase (amylomaltase) [hydrothermal vent metagenome]|uniref:4-alpha-glucanotransferase n=1 Tax=hydrothermal vent metagenome TaxID=652676 RepID=A0A3B0WVT9_9ZZZZ
MEAQPLLHEYNKQRRAGVLLHPTSLPGDMEGGDIGHHAYRFIEFLSSNGFKLWQMLPLGQTHDDKSPYQCLSSHAGNPLLISLDWLRDRGWLDKSACQHPDKKPDKKDTLRIDCLRQASKAFYQTADSEWMDEIAVFKNEHQYWLNDYTLFIALKQHNNNKPWYEWPLAERHCEPGALEDARCQLSDAIQQTVFEQFIFFAQWQEVRAYAKQHHIELFGDMPFFVARDSADVWAGRENFLIDADGDMPFVAGVPPDAFSETGQRWGNPLYNWAYMKSTGFSWWKDRFKTQLALFDMIRIDHFRGLQACWYIPAEDETAINGCWEEVPGSEMLSEMFSTFSHLPLIAEDLGVITDEVIALKKDFQLPGMKVLQFAFDGNNRNPHLPHCHQQEDIIYTGTHDNDTSLGWAENEHNYNKVYLREYIHYDIESDEQTALSLIRLAMSSVSYLSIIPMQDLLMLDSASRMNMPGTVGGNWRWRFSWDQLRQDVIETISLYMKLYQR